MKRCDNMSDERRQRLDAIGFIWDVLEGDWQEGFRQLKAFKDREGHCRVPDLCARRAVAVHRLFGEAGVNMDNAFTEHLAEATDKIVEDLPGRLRSFV